jgi:hypothetical protein
VRVSALLTALGLIGCGSSGKPTAARQFKGGAAKMGVVSGFVVDDETGAAIANAQVSIGGTAVRARSDGSFDATVPAGRARVEVTNQGFIQTVREVAIGDVALSLPFKLARKEEPKSVGSAGGTYRFREALLSVPAGVFRDGTMVSLTFLSKVRVAVTANSPQFIDVDHTPRRVVATVDLDASAPPAMPVRVRVPVPSDATMDSVKGFTASATGDWGAGLMPISVGAGFAEFELMGNGRIGVAVDARRADGSKVGYLVTEAADSPSAMMAGDVLPGGQDIMTASRSVAVVDPQGTRIEVAPNSRARAEVPAGEGGASRVAPFAGAAVLSGGSLRILVAKGDPSLVKLSIQTPAAKLEARGTAFSVTSCESGPGFVDVLSVTEGIVDAQFAGMTSPIAAGESITFCTKCEAGLAPMCFTNPDGGAVMTPDLGTVVPPDAAMVSTDLAVAQPDVGVVPPDAAELKNDAPVVVPPDAATPPADVAVVPPPDAAVVPPDAAVAPMDTMAPPPPDAAVVPPDAMVMPDMMAVAEDAEKVMPDASAPMLYLGPTMADFGTVVIGMPSAPIDFTIANNGGGMTGVPSLTITGDFYIESQNCTNSLGSGESCLARVKLLPMAAGTRNGFLNVTAPSGGMVTATLTGYGADQAKLEIQPLTFLFPNTPPGTDSTPATFIVKNLGGVTSGTPSLSVVGPDFVITTDDCKSPLASGATCLVTMVFRSALPLTLKQGSLAASAAPGGTGNVMLAGNTTYVEVTPRMYDFGNVMAGGSNSQNHGFTVKNIAAPGGPYISIMSMLNGTSVNDWRTSTDCPSGGNLLAPGAICQVGVDFAPISTGAKTIILDVSAHEATGAAAGADKAQLTGNGI